MSHTIDCSICSESYTTEGNNEPKVLPCGHTLCCSCVHKIENQLCPNCEKRFEMQFIVTNYTLRDLIVENNLIVENHLAQVAPPRKKYKYSEWSLEELTQELARRQQRNTLDSTRQALSDVVSSIDNINQERINIDRLITLVEEDLRHLKERKITINSELQVLRQKEVEVKTDVARLVSLINQYSARISSSSNYPVRISSSGNHHDNNNNLN